MERDYRDAELEWAFLEENLTSLEEHVPFMGQINEVLSRRLFELRARIEALEAAQQPQQDKLDRLIAEDAQPTGICPAPPAPAGGLVKRVEARIRKEDWMNYGIDEDECGDEDPTYRYTSAAMNDGCDVSAMQARAVLREVAAWLRSDGPDWPSVASLLEQEAER